jgi:CHASE3 domain sensor protein
MLKEFKLRNRILIGYILPLISLVGASAITLWNANRIKSVFQDVKRVDQEVVATQKLETALNEMVLGARGYLISPSDIYIDEYRQGSQNFNETAKAVEQSGVITQAEQQEYFKELTTLGQQV